MRIIKILLLSLVLFYAVLWGMSLYDNVTDAYAQYNMEAEER